MRAPLHPKEAERLAVLESLDMMDTEAEQAFDDIALLAKQLTGSEIALVTLLHTRRQWFKARVGTDVRETSAEASFCSYTILQSEPLQVDDATKDERFSDNVLVTGDHHVRAYLGVPLVVDELPIGSLCVINRSAQIYGQNAVWALEALGRQTSRLLQERLAAKRFEALSLNLRQAQCVLESQTRVIVEQDAQTRALLENLPAGAIMVTSEGRLRVNEYVEQLTGFSRVQLATADQWFELLHAELSDSARELYSMLSEEGPNRRCLLSIQTKDGQCKQIELSIGHYGASEIWFVLDATERVASEERFRALFTNTSVPYLIHSADYSIVDANEAAVAKIGCENLEQLRRLSILDYSPETQSDGRPSKECAEEVAGRLENEGFVKFDWTHLHRDGSTIPMEVSLSKVRLSGGDAVLAVWHDLRDRLKAEEDRRAGDLRLRSVLNSLEEGVIVQDAAGGIIECNPSGEKILGLGRVDLLGKSSGDPSWECLNENRLPFAAGDRPAVVALRTGETQRDVRMGLIGSEGDFRWLSVNAVPIFKDSDGKPTEVVVSFSDVTEQLNYAENLEEQMRRLHSAQVEISLKQQEIEEANARLKELSLTDVLTGLKNRRALEERLEVEAGLAVRHHTQTAALMLDIDHFKSHNDRLGHGGGDKILTEIGALLRNTVRSSDFVARFGGEEFSVILPQSDIHVAERLAERIRIAVEQFPWESGPVTVSIGCSALRIGIESSDEFLSRADKALYASKEAGRNRVTAAA